MINIHCATGKRKRTSYLFILLLFISVACSTDECTVDLLEHPGRWQGDPFTLTPEGVMKLDGEFKTVVYNPGWFTKFENFEFSAELLTLPGASAALIFHTNKRDTNKGYEVIIDNSMTGDWNHLLKTGSLSSVRNIYYNTVINESWFTLKVKVQENHICIAINDFPVVDYIEPEMPFRASQNDQRRLGAGTFAVKTGYHNAGIRIRNMHVTKLQAGPVMQNEDPGFTRQISKLHYRQLPVIDFHVHEKGDLTLPGLIERSAKLGINYGIAANCGLKFPIETDEQLADYLASISGLPIFKAMQAEGREWVDMFSPELVTRFDYTFTDAMTWTNRNGTRMRLWMPEETEVGDPEVFMEQLVAQIEKVVTEPVAIYVNPTYLPDEIAERYDELWTDERIDRVVKALKENGVALELNDRYRLPGSRVIEKAKEAGVKFAMGTNNTGSEDLGKLEWALEMVEQHQLKPTDMFLPSVE
ncbi:MAG: DUF1080 domain-containing protein [Bacteroidales bacterium]|nr:DUF1080 domain-containing protein [Bacteroidales bacterium]